MPVEKWVCAKKSLSVIDLILVFVESGITLFNCVNDSLKSFGIYLNSFLVRFCPKRLKDITSPIVKMLIFICFGVFSCITTNGPAVCFVCVPDARRAGVVFGFTVQNKTCWGLVIYLFIRHIIGKV